MIKTKEQIVGIRKSCQLASQCLDYIEEFVVPGVTTGKLNDLLDQYIQDNGATSACLGYKGYPKSVCISLNEVICHGIPDDRELIEGDIANIDVTTILGGYYGDTSRMYGVGEISEKAKKLIAITEKCLDLGIKEVKHGASIRNIGAAIYRHATNEGYGVVRDFCGHGVGVEFHEEPMIPHFPARYTAKMEAGMIFTIEPMINEGTHAAVILEDNWTAKTTDGKLSAQFEHTILVNKEGYEILT